MERGHVVKRNPILFGLTFVLGGTLIFLLYNYFIVPGKDSTILSQESAIQTLQIQLTGKASSNPIVRYTKDPNDEKLVPSNPAESATGISEDGQGAIWYWNPDSNKWE